MTSILGRNSRSTRPGRAPTVALVNNMPDSAFLDTENQFRRALTGSSGAGVRLRLYAVTEIPRSQQTAAQIRSRYKGLDHLWSHPPDALVVTGTEPTQDHLVDEPYWRYLARLLEWASSSVPTVLLSCLASHASLLLFDGIERVPRPHKCSGILTGRVLEPDHPLALGLPGVVRVPHSRVNDVPTPALVRAGYHIIIGSGAAGAGWSVATRTCGQALFVLCQGHPEYSTLSLLREYRRDVRRSLFGRGVPYPRLPEGYLPPEAVESLEAFACRAAEAGAAARDLWTSFPFDQVAAMVPNTWSAGSAAIYGNWLALARSDALALAA